MDLLKHYKNLLEIAGLRLDDKDMIHRQGKSEKVTNLFIQGKPVVMPTYQQLSSADISERLVFHPFAESSSKGESVIVSELRLRFCNNIGLRLASFFMRCFELGASKAEHHKLNPIQAEMLDAVRKIEPKNAAAIAELFAKLIRSPDKKNAAFMGIYLSRNGKVGAQDYARAGIVSFPLYSLVVTELEKTKDRDIEGIKMSEKDLQYIKGIYEYVFPLLKTDTTAYNRGSNSDVAPYMDALMKASAAVEGMLNEKIRLFEPIFNVKGGDESSALVPLPEDWMEAIDELSSLTPQIIKIPLQPGMDGQPKVSETLAGPGNAVQTAQVYTPPPQTTMQPAYPPGVLVPTAYAPAPVQMNPYMQQPMAQPMYYPPQQQGYPQQYQQPQPVYGVQPMQGANVNLNPYQQNMPYVAPYGAQTGKSIWD